ncbi:MAG: DNA alkylation repair protein [Slackia sp.]|nr:DNA alkylation repair protein [Slackia sp.]
MRTIANISHTERNLVERLFALQDVGYRDFQAKLIPTIDPASIIGVRIPDLRALAKEIAGTPDAEAFAASLPHAYLEEDGLHAFLIERIRNFDEAIRATDAFLPFVNNWETCDLMSPKAFGKNPDKLLAKIYEWMESDAAFTVRFGIGMLMRHFLDERFEERFLDAVANVSPAGWAEAPGTVLAQNAGAEKRETKASASIPDASYYVNMMRAWYFATALAKQPQATLPFIEKGRLDPWTHNKTIQKAIESRRIDADMKAHLRTLRIR